ncbi:TEB, partial [Symbiodinium microadriaticum]
GYVLLASDYAQIELRILAHFAMDAKLCAAFDSSSDIFAGIAAQWTGTPVDGISKDDRNRMKQICYALLYGAGPAKVAADAGCSIPEAEGLMRGFMTCYPGIKTFMNQVKNSCRSKGYVETLLGRRRHLRGISSANRKDRARAERQAVNTVCQGSAADLIKLAMINIQHRLVEEFGSRGYHGHCSYPGGALYARMDCVRLVLQVHDELVFEVEEEHLHEVACVVK